MVDSAHLHRFGERLGKPKPRKVLVFRALQLGDLLCTLPAFRALRAGLPQAEITLCGLPWARLFAKRFNRYFDSFIEFPGYPGLPECEPRIRELPAFFEHVQREKFDLAIQLHGSGAYVNSIVVACGAKLNAGFYLPGEYCPDVDRFVVYPNDEHEIIRNVRLMEFLGLPAQRTELEFAITARDELEFAQLPESDVLSRLPYVCIHPGARYLSRRWPVERFSEVATRLHEQGFTVVVTGSSDEVPLTERLSSLLAFEHINLAGKTTLGGLACLLRGARLLISNDTGISHVACGTGTPSVVIVMGSDPKRWAPLDRQRHRAIFEPMDCRPCPHFQCPIGHLCATLIAPDAVLRAADEVLQFCRNAAVASRPWTDLPPKEDEVLCADHAC
jgi:ADP-heptose:LPS heptosyltransferase